MRIHHLNCGTLLPRGGALLMPGGERMSCHCLLVETRRDGLLLVDTGLGARDMADPGGRLGAWFKHLANPVGDPEETAARQVARLGYRAEDVRHVVMTHLDLDHAGGLCDFPHATVHVMEAELQAATRPETPWEQRRYRPAHWAHDVVWQTYPTAGGELWRCLDGVRPLAGVDEEILLVPLAGHTRGHAGVAAWGEDTWLLHVGDAVMCARELEGRSMTRLGVYHRVADGDPAAGGRVRVALTRATSLGLRITTSHDYEDFRSLQSGAAAGDSRAFGARPQPDQAKKQGGP